MSGYLFWDVVNLVNGIQLNFPESTRASETALLFMQFIMRSLKPGGGRTTSKPARWPSKSLPR